LIQPVERRNSDEAYYDIVPNCLPHGPADIKQPRYTLMN